MGRADKPTISAFAWVPPFAQGQVRDLRIRWALEEIGRSYDTTLLDATTPRGSDYKAWQPFGQVPAFDDGAHSLFESGAILLYLGEQDARLLPREAKARWEAVAWLFAALNTIEPVVAMLPFLDIFNQGKAWAQQGRASAEDMIKPRLADLSAALEGREWLAGQFSIADIAMVSVLRILDEPEESSELVDRHPDLVAYRERGKARPAFQRALASQCGDFSQDPPEQAPKSQIQGETA